MMELGSLIHTGRPLAAPDSLFLEYESLLRKAVNRRQITVREADNAFEDLRSLQVTIIPLDEPLLARAYELAKLLGQSDVFDAAGYATAEAYGAEFWTSDRRFANAANTANLGSVRFIP